MQRWFNADPGGNRIVPGAGMARPLRACGSASISLTPRESEMRAKSWAAGAHGRPAQSQPEDKDA
jgi:hypothetical protein